MRAVLEIAGVENVLAKIYGSTNPVNVVRATIAALSSVRSPEEIAANPASHTGRFLAKLLPASKAARGSKPAATARPDVLPPRKNPRKKASA